MKCLSIFIITLFAIFTIINCSHSEISSTTELTKGKKAKGKSKSKGKAKGKAKGKGKAKKAKKVKTIITCKNKCKKKKTKIPILPKPLPPLKLSAGDYTVCQSGKNLGLLDIGYTCQMSYSTCKRMVVRKPYIPVKSKIKKVKAAKKLLKASKKSAIKRKPKKKWTLKGRYAKFHPKKKLTPKQKAKLLKAKLKKMKNKKLKKWAKKVVNQRINAKSKTKKSLKNKAKKVINKVLQGKLSSVKKSLHLKTNKQKNAKKAKLAKKLKKKMEPEKGKYCVQAVEMNLSYCCLFHRRSLAQKLANEQPAAPHFMRQVRKGWISKVKDRERKAALKIKESARLINLMNKAKKGKRNKKNAAKKAAKK